MKDVSPLVQPLAREKKTSRMRLYRCSEREILMVARILVTLVLLLFAAGGFFGGATEPVGPLNPFGILFLFLSGVVWFAWDLVREAFADCLNVMAMRLGPMFRHKPVVDPIPPAEPPPAEGKRAQPKP